MEGTFHETFVLYLEKGFNRDQSLWKAKQDYDRRTAPESRSYWIDSPTPLPQWFFLDNPEFPT